MVFSLEALQAFHGDSLLLHVDDKLCLIDGGPSGPGRRACARGSRSCAPGAAHAADRPGDGQPHRRRPHPGAHRHGGALVELKDDSQPLPYEVGCLWHNAFDDVLGNRAAEVPAAPAPVVASVGQGRVLRDQAIALGWPRNQPFAGLVIAPREVPFGAAKLTVVAPGRDRARQARRQVGGVALPPPGGRSGRRVRRPLGVQPVEHRRARRGGREVDAAVRRRARRPRADGPRGARASWPPAARSRSTSSSSPTTARSATSTTTSSSGCPRATT